MKTITKWASLQHSVNVGLSRVLWIQGHLSTEHSVNPSYISQVFFSVLGLSCNCASLLLNDSSFSLVNDQKTVLSLRCFNFSDLL